MGEAYEVRSRDVSALLYQVKRWLLIVAGTACVCLGVIGIFLPLVPTTPLLLLAAVCYAGSSRKFYHWLMNNRWFGSYIRNYREGRGLTVAVKVLSTVSLWATILYSASFVVQSAIARVALLVIAVAVTAHILSRPTYRKTDTC